MARKDFKSQLQELGYQVEERGGNRLAFPYTVQVGKYEGEQIWMGFEVAEDFPNTPPGGPHVSPRLLPIQSGGVHPTGGIHESNFGQDWQYWSRPFTTWAQTDRTVRAYMAHIRHLFATQ